MPLILKLSQTEANHPSPTSFTSQGQIQIETFYNRAAPVKKKAVKREHKNTGGHPLTWRRTEKQGRIVVLLIKQAFIQTLVFTSNTFLVLVSWPKVTFSYAYK